ncbi:MAG TPA: hypothetical protein DDY98_07310 [Ruminococcaceae bacterium]|nr:hypothetical protein [Oscillospiraceae bacterium]
MTKSMKKSVRIFQKKYRLNAINRDALLSVFREQGYTLIPFHAAHNQADVAQVIENLNLMELVSVSNGFTFVNERFRLVFVNEDLSDEEQLIVLAHEEGHIFLQHIQSQSILGQDVMQEHEANEFAHFLLHPSGSEKGKRWIALHKKAVCVMAACLMLVAIGTSAFVLTTKADSYYGNFYITETGKKYHKKDCIYVKNKKNIHRMTKEEFESGEYDACKVCLPDK